ncbi:MAG: sigma-70 family RNA polymerase sigma factor [Chloroflexi bacterium]|nr:sigma-70 family RNA polymerase sigma factor [Chloroflexota bacterium]
MQNLRTIKSRALASADEDALLVEAAQHESTALATLYRNYVTRVYRYVRSRVNSPADAEDLTAQVFTEMVEGLHRYHGGGSFAAWLFSIAHHKVADHYRRRRPDLPLDETFDVRADDVDPLAHLVQEETLQRLAMLVARLNEDQQELLQLRFAGGLTYGEIGRIVSRSEAAVKMAVYRLLQRLEAEWEGSDE